MKKKLLIIGITMNGAGTEKSFLSFAECLDYDKYDVDLILAKKDGLFLPLIPPQINVIEMGKYSELFFLSSKNAPSLLWDTFVKEKPSRLLEIIPYFLWSFISPKNRQVSAIRMWVKLLRHMAPLDKHYDAAVAYWGDRTIFYMIDKVKADKKIAWMHFDYNNPKRDDKTYLHYFKQCDSIVNVSETVDGILKQKLPEIADKCTVIENIQNRTLIKRMALEGKSYPDETFKGQRILTVARITEQKGLDLAIPALARLKREGYKVRWYIIGDGEESYVEKIKSLAVDCDVADTLIFLGTTTNPYPYMRDCTVYAQPSRHEGKPISVEEVKIMCCPIVACNYLSAMEQLDGGKLGLVVPISEDGIYEGLKKLLDDGELRAGFSERLNRTELGNSDEINKFYALL
ncbi:MAG: glycosyltransferase [Eubacteriales bacterium]